MNKTIIKKFVGVLVHVFQVSYYMRIEKQG